MSEKKRTTIQLATTYSIVMFLGILIVITANIAEQKSVATICAVIVIIGLKILSLRK